MRLSQSLLSANVKGMYHKPEGPAFCYVNSYKIFISLNDWYTILWRSFEPTLAEWHFLWSRRSTTNPPRLDTRHKSTIWIQGKSGIQIVTGSLPDCLFLLQPITVDGRTGIPKDVLGKGLTVGALKQLDRETRPQSSSDSEDDGR